MDAIVDPKEVVATEPLKRVGNSLVESITQHGRTQHLRDGHARLFNQFAPQVGESILRHADQLLMAPVEFPNTWGEGINATLMSKHKKMEDAMQVTMLSPEAKLLSEITLEAFVDFKNFTDDFKGGGRFGSILGKKLGDEKNSESNTITIGDKEIKKYDTYWDYSEAFTNAYRYDGENGHPRDNRVSQDLRKELEHREKGLFQKIKSGEYDREDLKNYLISMYMNEFGKKAHWTFIGEAIDERDRRN